MTTITIDKLLLEQVQDLLYRVTRWKGENHEVLTDLHDIKEAVKAVLAAPATAPEPVAWLAHYVGRSGVEQEYVSTDKTLADENDASGKARPLYLHPPATAPAWHDAPTVPGLWFCDEGDENPYRFTCHNVSIPLNPHLVGEGERWYGPIPPDGDKP